MQPKVALAQRNGYYRQDTNYLAVQLPQPDLRSVMIPAFIANPTPVFVRTAVREEYRLMWRKRVPPSADIKSGCLQEPADHTPPAAPGFG